MEDQLKLSNQICFPLYALSKEVIGLYRSFLQELDLTYPQYLVMMALWEENEQTVSDLGEKLTLDSGTLTPLLKRLEQKGLVTRERSKTDERVVNIHLSPQGSALEMNAVNIPSRLKETIQLSDEELQNLKVILEKVMNQIKQNK